MLLLIFTLSMIFIFVLHYSTLFYLRWYKGFPEGEYGLPIIGSMLNMFLSGDEQQYIAVELSKRYTKGIYSFMLGTRKVVLIDDPKILKKCYYDNSKIFSSIPDFNTWKAGMPFYIGSTRPHEGKKWRKLRNICSQRFIRLFTTKWMDEKVKYELYDAENSLFKKLDKFALAEKNWSPETDLASTIANIMLMMLVGERNDPDDVEMKSFVTYAKKLLDCIASLGLGDFIPQLGKIFPASAQTARTCKIMRSKCAEIVRRRHEKEGKTWKITEPECFADDLLIELRKGKIQEWELGLMVRSMLVAGTDTTSSTLLFSCIYLTAYPEIHQQIINEFEKLGCEKGEFLNHDVCKKNMYLEAFLWEIWRHCHVGFVGLFYETRKDVTVDGYYFPKGTIVSRNTYGMGHNKNYWTNPDKFDISRWIKDGKFDNSLDKQNMHTFSTGSRTCPGQAIAKMDILIILGNLIWRYNFDQGEKFTSKVFEYKKGQQIKRPAEEPKIRLTIR